MTANDGSQVRAPHAALQVRRLRRLQGGRRSAAFEIAGIDLQARAREPADLQASNPMMPLVPLTIVLLLMIGEALHAARNERGVLARGGVEPPGDVYKTMRWAYPLCFIAMAAESLVHAPFPTAVMLAGVVVFVLAKALKYWAIATLGPRWTFRVLVLPSAPLVVTGPYRRLRHPNYVAVVGELMGAALMFSAPLAGALSIVIFGWLMLRRIAVEDRALGRS